MPVITLTHLPGTFGEEIANRLSAKLGIPLFTKDYSKEILKDIASDYDLSLLDESPKHYLRNAQNNINFRDNLIHRLNKKADHESFILLGTTPGLFLAKHPNAINVQITAPKSVRKKRLLKVKGNNERLVNQIIKYSNRDFTRFGKILFDKVSRDPYLYHATINTAKVSVDTAVIMLSALFNERRAKEVLFDTDEEEEKIHYRQEQSTEMKNKSELEFSKVLDMYHIRWVYEPKTFTLETDEEGNITLGFSPDFYLPQYDVYLELTVMNPKYSSEKKQKVERIKELYPGTNVKLVQKKDFDHFLRSLQRASTILLNAEEKKEILANESKSSQ